MPMRKVIRTQLFNGWHCLQTDESESDEDPSTARLTANGAVLTINGQECKPGDCIYLAPSTFDQAEGAAEDASTAQVPDYAAKGRYHKGGGNAGLRAWCIARISQLGGVKASGKQSSQVRCSCWAVLFQGLQAGPPGPVLSQCLEPIRHDAILACAQGDQCRSIKGSPKRITMSYKLAGFANLAQIVIMSSVCRTG